MTFLKIIFFLLLWFYFLQTPACCRGIQSKLTLQTSINSLLTQTINKQLVRLKTPPCTSAETRLTALTNKRENSNVQAKTDIKKITCE